MHSSLLGLCKAAPRASALPGLAKIGCASTQLIPVYRMILPQSWACVQAHGQWQPPWPGASSHALPMTGVSALWTGHYLVI